MDPASFNEFFDRKMAQMFPINIGKVSALGDDGRTVNLAFGTGVINDVQCGSGYPIRTIGDDVLVFRVPAGNWVVVCSLNAVGITDYVTTDQLEDATDKLTADLTNKINDVKADVPEVLFGSAAPGAGWTQATSSYFQDAGNGKRRSYYQTGTPPVSSVKPPAPVSQTAPKSVTINPTARGSWRSSGQTDDDVWQSDWNGDYGNWIGAWFYGNAIAAACAGKTVRDIRLKLSRTKSGGTGSGAQSRIGLHDKTAKGNPPQIVNSRYGPKLEQGESKWWTLPAAFVSSLASGATKGFFCEGSGRGQYIHYAGSAGQLIIRFNAS